MNLGLLQIVEGIFTAIKWLLYARIILSFLPMFMRIDPYNPIVRFIVESTEPLMAPFRRLLPPIGGFDFSILILWFVLQVVEGIVLQLVSGIGGSF